MANTVFQSPKIKVRVKDSGSLQSTTPVTLKNTIGQSRSLTELNDIQVINPSDGNILAFNANTSQWYNRLPPTLTGNTQQFIISNTTPFDYNIDLQYVLNVRDGLNVSNGFSTNSSVTYIANGNFTNINVGNAYIANGIVVNGSASLKNIIPDANNVYTIGNSSLRFAELWLSGNTLYMGNVVFNDTTTSLELTTANGDPVALSVGNTSVSGSLNVQGTFETESVAANTITIHKTSNLQGNVAIGGNLVVTGTINRNPNINVVLSGDITGNANATATDLANVTITVNTSIAPQSVELGVDTTGEYVGDLIQGTGVILTGTGGDNATPTISIGQDVATTANVTFRDMNLTGNLTVSGTTTYINTTQLNVGDNIITLNADVVGAPTENAGIEINRGTSANVSFLWNESSKYWSLGNTNISGDLTLPAGTVVTDNTIASWFVSARSLSIITQETTSTGIWFKPDGTKLYVVGQTSDAVNEYNLSTPWDVTTAVYSQNVSILAQDTASSDVVFRDSDGLKMYVLGDTANALFEYDLATAWNVTTATYLQTFAGIGTQDATPNSIFFKSDGTKMWMLGGTNNTIYQYSLATAWNISTATYDTKSLALTTFSSTGQSGMTFSTDGSSVYVIGTTLDCIMQYTLSTPWDISTGTFTQKVYIGNLESTGTYLYFAQAQNKMFVGGTSADKIWDISTNTAGQRFTANTTLFNGQTRVSNNFAVSGNTNLDGNIFVVGSSTLQSTTATSLGVGNVSISTSVIQAGNTVQNSFFSNSFIGMSLNIPGTATMATATTGGTLAAGTYYYRITAIDANGIEGLGSVQSSQVTTGTTSTVTLTFAPVPGAFSYRVYRSTTTGVFTAGYIAVPISSLVVSGTNYAYTDTGTALTVATLPTATNARVLVVNSVANGVSWFGPITVKAQSNVGILTIAPDAVLTVGGAGTANIGGNTTIGGSTGTAWLQVGNTTVNTFANSSLIKIANSTAIANLTPNSLVLGTTTVNSTAIFVGANVFANATYVYVGNSTVYSAYQSTQMAVANSSYGFYATPGNIAVMNGSDGAITIGNDNLNGAIEIGKSGRTVAGTPYLDFHSSVSSPDYDVRIIVAGGNSTPGSGNVQIFANVVNVPNTVITGTANASVAFNVGANVTANTTTLFVGNSTVNTVITSAQITTTNAVSNGVNANTITANIAVFNTSASVGANVIANTTALFVGNATVNSVLTSSTLAVSGNGYFSNRIGVSAQPLANTKAVFDGSGQAGIVVNRQSTYAITNANVAGGATAKFIVSPYSSSTNGYISVASIHGPSTNGFTAYDSRWYLTSNATGSYQAGMSIVIDSNNDGVEDLNYRVFEYSDTKFEIFTANNSRIFVAANGNVGIGTSTPGALFVVNGAGQLGNTAIVGFINVSSTANVGGVLNARSDVVVNGALTVANTAALGNTTITGFANVGNLQVTDTIAGNNMTLTGNLTVSGTTTYINTTTLNIGDNIITLNADLGAAVAPTENVGIEVNRGSAANVSFLWDETNKYWTFSNTMITGTANVQGQFAVANSTATAFVVTPGANVVNYVQISGSVAGGGPVISAQGSDTNVRLNLSDRGSGGIQFNAGGGARQFYIGPVPNAVNYIALTGAISGSAPNLSVAGTDTNIDFSYTTKGTGAHNFQTGTTSATQARVVDNAGANRYVELRGGVSGTNSPGVGAAGGTAFGIYSTGGGSINFFTGGYETTRQAVITHVASAVNYINLYGAPTNGTPTIQATGADANVTLVIAGKGAGYVVADNPGYGNYFQAQHAGATVTNANFIRVVGTATGSGPQLKAIGTDTNIDLNLYAQGTGVVNSTAPVQIETDTVVTTKTLTTTATTASQVIATFAAATYRSAEFIIQATDTTGTKYQKTKMLAVHNGTTAEYVEYGNVNIGGDCGTFDVTYSTGIQLRVTPASTNSTVFKVTCILTKL